MPSLLQLFKYCGSLLGPPCSTPYDLHSSKLTTHQRSDHQLHIFPTRNQTLGSHQKKEAHSLVALLLLFPQIICASLQPKNVMIQRVSNKNQQHCDYTKGEEWAASQKLFRSGGSPAFIHCLTIPKYKETRLIESPNQQ